jgi:hypothetical protein
VGSEAGAGREWEERWTVGIVALGWCQLCNAANGEEGVVVVVGIVALGLTLGSHCYNYVRGSEGVGTGVE